MKKIKFAAVIAAAVVLTACTAESSKTYETGDSVNDAEIGMLSDAEITEKFNAAEDLLVKGMIFTNDGNGGFFSEDGQPISACMSEYEKYFTADSAEKMLDLYAYTGADGKALIEFDISPDEIENETENYIRFDPENVSSFNDYEKVTVGGKFLNDISVYKNELMIGEKTADNITLKMTVLHKDPNYLPEAGEDSVYGLNGGKPVVIGVFGGYDGSGNEVLLSEASKAETADNITYDSQPYWIESYEYHLVPENGEWKFDGFEIFE